MKKDTGKAFLAVEKSWDDTDSDDEDVENFALMAISDNASSSKPQVTFIDVEMVYHLGGTLDCANREIARTNLLFNALEKEVNDLRAVHIIQDKQK